MRKVCSSSTLRTKYSQVPVGALGRAQTTIPHEEVTITYRSCEAADPCVEGRQSLTPSAP